MTQRPRRGPRTRLLRTALLTLLFALLALSIFTWLRSYWASDAWSYREARMIDRRVDVLLLDAWSGRGSLIFSRQSWHFTSHGDRSGRRVRWTRHPPTSATEGLAPFDPVILLLGFGHARDATRLTPVSAIVIPCWAIVLLLSLPTAWLARRACVTARRRRLGLCDHCGYDLRASTGACPECGAEIPVAAADAAQPDTRAATPA